MADLILNFPNLPPAIQQQILDGPALAPPKGVIPNLKNPPNSNVEAIVVLVVCLFLSTVAGLFRAYTRIFIVRKVYLQDYLGLLAYGSYIVLVWVYLDFLHIGGFFVHQWDVTFRNIIPIGKILTFGLTIAYSATLLFAKTAILIEWVQIFSPYRTHHWFFWSCYTLIILNVLLYVSSIVSSAITCLPHDSIWYPWISGRCIDRKALGLFTAFFNVLVDLLILILPQQIIWSLQMTRSRKIGISLVFSVGLIATVCAAGRVAATFGIEYKGDATYTVAPILLWAIPEVSCVLLVFCLPALPKAFSKQGLLFKTLSIVRSWTRLPTPRARKSPTGTDNKPQWPQAAGRPDTQQYHEVDEDGHATSLTELELLRHQRPQRGNHPPSHESPDLSIVKTVEVEQRKDSASGATVDQWTERQHPWMGIEGTP